MLLPQLTLRCLVLVALTAIGAVVLAIVSLVGEPLGHNFLVAAYVFIGAIAAAAYSVFHVLVRRPIKQLQAMLQQVHTHGTQLAATPTVDGLREFRDMAESLNKLIAEHNRLFDSLAGRTLIDPVTNLPNRPRFTDLLRRQVDQAQRDFKPFALLLMDLDEFKVINNTLGHHIGDLLLRQVAERLQRRLRNTDVCARIGGDEFGILLEDVDEKDAQIAARMLLQSLRVPFTVDGQTLDIAASLGIAMYPDHGVDAATLIKRADVAMYHAKEKTRGFVLYEDGMDPNSSAHLHLLGQLRHALEREEFSLFYQPKVSLHDNVISGVEALVRWQHPDGTLYMPDTFIPILERNGLIRTLTAWLLGEAFAFCRQLHEAGYPLTVSLNLSVRDLQDAHFIDIVNEQLAINEIDPRTIVLEVTESAVMTDPEHAIRVLQRLADMGFTISIDDFGTGYSSLAYLKQLPVREVKIDKTFILNMSNDVNDAAIVRTSIELARNLDLAVVAEGVENAEILTRLRQLDCDAVQGMYISRPLDSMELREWLSKSAWAHVVDENSMSAAHSRSVRRWH